MITGSKELIRDINSQLVLETIINSQPLSRAQLAKRLGLTKATISAIVQDLIAGHLVIELGSGDSSVGRKPILLSFNQNAGYVISIDLSIDTITILRSDLKGENCTLSQHPYDGSTDSIIPALKKTISSKIAGTPSSHYGIVGISIGIHGIVHDNQIIFSPHYTLERINLATALQQHFNIPVFIENEANLSVLGEHSFCYNYPNMINLSIHSGIGMGIMINHSLYTGFHGYAGEFGHTIVVPGGRSCPCGNHGCIEQYASERALLKEFALKKKSDRISAEDFIAAFQKGDTEAEAALNDFIKYIAIAVNNILNVFNPEILIINSSFTTHLPGLTSQVQHQLRNRMSDSCQVVPSILQDTAILLGGVCICIKNFLNIDVLKLSHDPRRLSGR